VLCIVLQLTYFYICHISTTFSWPMVTWAVHALYCFYTCSHRKVVWTV
jgi:hypothetical protein